MTDLRFAPLSLLARQLATLDAWEREGGNVPEVREYVRSERARLQDELARRERVARGD